MRSDLDRRAIARVRCPHCGAPVGRQCAVPSSGRPLRSGCHPSRHDALSTHQPILRSVTA